MTLIQFQAGTGTSGRCSIHTPARSGTKVAPVSVLIINAANPNLSFTRDDVQAIKITAASAANYFDSQNTNIAFRYGATGSTTAMVISGTDGSVTCSKDLNGRHNICSQLRPEALPSLP